MQEVVRRFMGPDVPIEERALVTLHGAHYIDHHAMAAEDAQRWSPEQWGRAMFEDRRSLLQRTRDLGFLGALLSSPNRRAVSLAGRWTTPRRGGCAWSRPRN